MVYFPTIFIVPITIGFKYNPSTAFVFLHMCSVLIHYGNSSFPNFFNYIL